MTYIFLSYAKADRDTAFAMRDVLKKEGFRVWMDENEHELNFWHWGEIQKNIREAWAFVLLVSEAANQSAWVKRELAYAKKIGKPCFQIVTQGEGWEGIYLGVIRFNLGLSLDISDEEVAKLKDLMPSPHKQTIPRQIPENNNAKTLRYMLNWAAIIGIVLLVIFRILPLLQDYIGQQNPEASASSDEIAIPTTTETYESQIGQTATAYNQQLPCNATVFGSLFDARSRLIFRRLPSLAEARTGRGYSGQSLEIIEVVLNEDRLWYRASGGLGYALAEDLVLDTDCPR